VTISQLQAWSDKTMAKNAANYRRIVCGESPVRYRTDLAVPSDFFAQALENTPWQTEPGIMGKAALRKTALWGAPYDYLGVQSNQPIDGPLPEFLAKLKKINDDALGVVTDSVLLNLYQDGRAGINAHSDWGHPGIIG
jgi:alkylated DNA repair dioxygenase AlkB